jgi:hypothetical protein
MEKLFTTEIIQNLPSQERTLPTWKTLSEIGIQPIQKPKTHAVMKPVIVSHIEGVPRLDQLVTAQVQRILNGENPYGDRSHSMLVAALELHGWMNWAQRSGIQISGDPESLLLAAAECLGVEAGRVDRILKDRLDAVPTSSPVPGEPHNRVPR